MFWADGREWKKKFERARCAIGRGLKGPKVVRFFYKRATLWGCMSAKVTRAQISTWSCSSTSWPSLGCCFGESCQPAKPSWRSQSGCWGRRIRVEGRKRVMRGDKKHRAPSPSPAASVRSFGPAQHWPGEVRQMCWWYFHAITRTSGTDFKIGHPHVKHKQDIFCLCFFFFFFVPPRARFKRSYPRKHNEAVLKIVPNCVQCTSAHSHTVVDKQPNDVWNTDTSAMICCGNCHPPVCGTNKCGIGGQTH